MYSDTYLRFAMLIILLKYSERLKPSSELVRVLSYWNMLRN